MPQFWDHSYCKTIHNSNQDADNSSNIVHVDSDLIENKRGRSSINKRKNNLQKLKKISQDLNCIPALDEDEFLAPENNPHLPTTYEEVETELEFDEQNEKQLSNSSKENLLTASKLYHTDKRREVYDYFAAAIGIDAEPKKHGFIRWDIQVKLDHNNQLRLFLPDTFKAFLNKNQGLKIRSEKQRTAISNWNNVMMDFITGLLTTTMHQMIARKEFRQEFVNGERIFICVGQDPIDPSYYIENFWEYFKSFLIDGFPISAPPFFGTKIESPSKSSHNATKDAVDIPSSCEVYPLANLPVEYKTSLFRVVCDRNPSDIFPKSMYLDLNLNFGDYISLLPGRVATFNIMEAALRLLCSQLSRFNIKAMSIPISISEALQNGDDELLSFLKDVVHKFDHLLIPVHIIISEGGGHFGLLVANVKDDTWQYFDPIQPTGLVLGTRSKIVTRFGSSARTHLINKLKAISKMLEKITETKWMTGREPYFSKLLRFTDVSNLPIQLDETSSGPLVIYAAYRILDPMQTSTTYLTFDSIMDLDDTLHCKARFTIYEGLVNAEAQDFEF